MRYNVLFDTLQNLIKRKPSQKEIGNILNLAQTAISGRANRNSAFSDEELGLIEKHYGVSLRGGNSEDAITLDYYPDIFGSCGDGVFALSERKETIQVPVRLFEHISYTKKYSVINAVGDSMNPGIKDKDRLIVEHWQGEQIKDNKIYVFCYKDEIFIKRLVKNVDEIIIKSDNPDPIYRARFIEKEDMNNIIIVGEIIGLIRDIR